jgi:hypothetical protein
VFAESPLRGSICVKMFVPIFVRGDDSSAYDFAAYHADARGVGAVRGSEEFKTAGVERYTHRRLKIIHLYSNKNIALVHGNWAETNGKACVNCAPMRLSLPPALINPAPHLPAQTPGELSATARWHSRKYARNAWAFSSVRTKGATHAGDQGRGARHAVELCRPVARSGVVA